MRHLSTWAKHHFWLARFTIIISRIALFWIAIYLGKQYLLSGYEMNPYALYIFAFIFCVIAFLYPRKTEKKVSYAHRKSFDGLLALSVFAMVFSIGNGAIDRIPAIDGAYANRTALSIKPPTAKEILESLKHRDKHDLTKQEKRILKKEFRTQLKVYVKATLQGDKQARDNSGLIILAIIGAIGLWLLVLSLACSLSCNGSDGAAVVVGLLGTAGIIWALIAVIRSIKRKGKKKEAVPAGT